MLKNKSRPCDVAYIAVALYRLGRVEEAKAALDRLRDLLKDESFAEDEKAKVCLTKVEKLINGEKQ